MYPISSLIVPSRSRNAARRNGCVSDISGAPYKKILRRIFKSNRGGEHGIHGNPRHAPMIDRTPPQKTWTAGNGLSNQSELFRHGSSALRICRPKNADDRKARGGGHMHGAGI